jgi:hypothetical protein
VIPGGLGRAVLESDQHIEQELRFQLPAVALPLKIERAQLTAKLDAPSRRVAFAASEGQEFRELASVVSPLAPMHVEVVDSRLLQLDAEGGLHIRITLGETLKGDRSGVGVFDKWRIEYIELEITGRME